ncbi:Alpha-tubulin suppressor and related RCC1 domain-containing protein-like protein [Desulfitobacterium hafniense]|uniref:Alpha-tubulin suppressor and related RCC1 domain-containing protein-like protein n=2 Tax=Desulfitobacterium hafniense TaxID=49338 RepID=A0A098B0U3_DESHA|nr:Alpha-tubulin suppressor and related RCC1 domain-containing protein-like protein [Desulfitobacterium hafniense]
MKLMVMLILLTLLSGGCADQQVQQQKIVQIACGNDFSLFLYDTGKVRAIGKNSSGQLGVGDTEDRYELTEVLLPEAVSEIGVSDDSAFALTQDGTLYTWGDNRCRQAENSAEPAVPTPIRYQIKEQEKVTQFALGWYASYGLTESDVLYGWGSKLGLVTLEDLNYEPIYQAVPLPQSRAFPIVDGKENKRYIPPKISKIDISNYTIMGIGDDGTFFGPVGENIFGAIPYTPGEIVKIAAGRLFCVLLTAEGSLYLWGDNFRGELASGDYQLRKVPLFRSFAEDPLRDVAVGPSHILALTRSGKVLAWGDNARNQLGLADRKEVLSPENIAFPEKITLIATGFHHSDALGESGKLYAFDANDYGQLMTGDQTSRDTPAVADLQSVVANPDPVIIPEFSQEVAIAATMEAFLTESGRVFTKGPGDMGTLGTATANSHEEPTYVPMSEAITQIEAGLFTFTVLTAKGEVYNWGLSQLNSLGHDHKENKWYLTPTQVPLPEKITKIRSDMYSTGALAESGNWYMWGDNTYGSLATGTKDYAAGPVKLETPVPFAELFPSRSYWLALTAEGEVYQWGTWQNKFAEEMYMPDVQTQDLKYQKIALPEKVIKAKSTAYDNFVLSATGNLYAWGFRFKQEPQIFLENVQDFVVSPRESDFLALTHDGKVYYWGYNLMEPYIPVEIHYPEIIRTVFPGEGIFYAAGEEAMYMVYDTWIQEGMKTNEFLVKVDYRYKK